MSSIITRRRKQIRRQRQTRDRMSETAQPTRDEIEKAMEDYFAKGGKITRIEPEWIIEGQVYTYS